MGSRETLETLGVLPKTAAMATSSKALPTPRNAETSKTTVEAVKGDVTAEGAEQGGKLAAASAPTTPVAENDIQKKKMRAERFGVSVVLSEEEKRCSRAERFGTGSSAEGSGLLEEKKRKARAERFGIPSLSATDEESKKKARLARFGQEADASASEEEKRKARTLRFSRKTSSVAQTNGNDKLKKTVASIA